MFEPEFDNPDEERELTREELVYIRQTGQCPNCREGVLNKKGKGNPRKHICSNKNECGVWFELEFSSSFRWKNLIAGYRIRKRKFTNFDF